MPDIRLDDARDVVNIDILGERLNQLNKWGPQTHPDGTSDEYAYFADYFRACCDHAAKHGHVTWADIALEEFFEALAETDYHKLRKELVQTAAVLTAWVEDLDNRYVGESLTEQVQS